MHTKKFEITNGNDVALRILLILFTIRTIALVASVAFLALHKGEVAAKSKAAHQWDEDVYDDGAE